MQRWELTAELLITPHPILQGAELLVGEMPRLIQYAGHIRAPALPKTVSPLGPGGPGGPGGPEKKVSAEERNSFECGFSDVCEGVAPNSACHTVDAHCLSDGWMDGFSSREKFWANVCFKVISFSMLYWQHLFYVMCIPSDLGAPRTGTRFSQAVPTSPGAELAPPSG